MASPARRVMAAGGRTAEDASEGGEDKMIIWWSARTLVILSVSSRGQSADSARGKGESCRDADHESDRRKSAAIGAGDC